MKGPFARTVVWMITARCNRQCWYCWNIGQRPSRPPRSPTAIAARLCASPQVERVSFTGGEPALSPALCGIVEMLARADKVLRIYTNGQLFRSAAWSAMRELPFLEVFVSLPLYEPGTSVDAYRIAVRRLGDLGRRSLRGSTVKAALSMLVHAGTSRAAAECVVAAATEFGYDGVAASPLFVGPKADEPHPGYAVTDENRGRARSAWRGVRAVMGEAREDGLVVPSDSDLVTAERVVVDREPPLRACPAGTSFSVIDWEGRARPCFKMEHENCKGTAFGPDCQCVFNSYTLFPKGQLRAD